MEAQRFMASRWGVGLGMFYRQYQFAVPKDARLVVREDMVPAMLGKHGDGFLRRTMNMEGPLKLET